MRKPWPIPLTWPIRLTPRSILRAGAWPELFDDLVECDPAERRARLEVAAGSQSDGMLARERVEVTSKAAVLPALGRAVLQLRRTLGESAPTMRELSTPIERATRVSLDALKSYALGVDRSRHGDYPTAASLFQRAVQIDPDFAMAHMALAREEMSSNHTERVTGAATRAFELRGRVTPWEQARIVVFYHLSVTGDLDQAIAAATMSQRTCPSEGRLYIHMTAPRSPGPSTCARWPCSAVAPAPRHGPSSSGFSAIRDGPSGRHSRHCHTWDARARRR